jgi:hypothetical protein
MFIVDTFKFYDEDGKQLPVVKEEQVCDSDPTEASLKADR